MISYLRNLRRSFLSQNRFYKYFLYAIGEIFLVVIGILIALQINNWNEERKSRMSEKKILERLALEFEGASFELTNDMNARKEILGISGYLADLHLDGESLSFNPDSLSYSLSQLMRARFFTQSHPALNDLQSSGRLELLLSEQLKEYLLDYLQAKERLAAFEKNESEFVDNTMTPYLADQLDLLKFMQSKSDLEKEEVLTFQKLLKKPKMGSLLYQRTELTNRALFYSDIMDGIIKDVLAELKKSNDIFNL